MPVDYDIYPHIDARALRDYAASSANLARALEHRARVKSIVSRVRSGELSEPDGARLCLKECNEGIDLLKTGSSVGNHMVLNVLSEFREKRAVYANRATMDDLTWQKASPAEIEANCRRQFEDATAVIDLAPTHSTPEMVRCARGSRMAAMGYLNNSLKVNGIEREKRIALEDARAQQADPDASDFEKAFAAQCAAYLMDMVSCCCQPFHEHLGNSHPSRRRISRFHPHLRRTISTRSRRAS